MWAKTLAEAYERIYAGEPREFVFAGFLDTFYRLGDSEARSAALADEPPLTKDEKLDALAGAAAEYLAKQYWSRVPEWAAKPVRYLREPWFTTENPGPGMIEYLVHCSPASSARAISTPRAGRFAGPRSVWQTEAAPCGCAVSQPSL